MQNIIEQINILLRGFKNENAIRLEKLPQSGSNRIYFRAYYPNKTFIITYNSNIKENKTFLYFSKHFKQFGLAVPEIFCVNDDETIYIQEDFGNASLLSFIETQGHNNYVYSLFQKSLKNLAHIQINGHKGLDYNQCITAKEFGKQAIISDLLYFKYYFLDTLQYPYDKQALLDDFEALAIYLTKTEYKYFMFRDFQSRNIMIQNDEPFFIDYQGGMQGALQYDVASLLWQAKAELSDEWKNNLLDYYMDEADALLDKPIDRNIFISQYNGYVLIRLLQVLGAYGFRGLFERKAHFLASIPLALQNLKWFVENKRVGIITPEFDKVLQFVISNEVITGFTPVTANADTPLIIHINSFSYKKGIPVDNSNNGGGFVFDCRGILNPGRFEEYKTLSGKDKPVIDFLEQRTRMNEFLNSVFDIVDISVEDYIKRNFESLQINFGCTGGQHRSVYAAEQTARHLRNKYKVKVELQHCNKDNWSPPLPPQRGEVKTLLNEKENAFAQDVTNTPPSGGQGGALLLCAGLGTRLKPFTDKHPKALASVNNKSLLQRNIEWLQGFGIKNVIVNVHHFAEQIIDAIEKNNGWGSSISISDERDEVLETGGGLKKAAWYFANTDDFVLMNVDILTDLNLHDMMAYHQKHKPLATLATTSRETSRYFLFDDKNKLCGWENVKTGERKPASTGAESLNRRAFSGIHIINRKIFDVMNQEGKFSMVDVYLSLCSTHTILSFDHSQSKFIDVGKPESLLKAEEMFV